MKRNIFRVVSSPSLLLGQIFARRISDQNENDFVKPDKMPDNCV